MHDLTRLLLERRQLSMRDTLSRIALLHCQINAPGFVLALTGHYRKAYEELRGQPHSATDRYASVQRRYVLALYAEQLSPQETHHFAAAEAELKHAVSEIEGRYGWEWVSLAGVRYEMDLYAELEKVAQQRYRPLRPAVAALR